MYLKVFHEDFSFDNVIDVFGKFFAQVSVPSML